MEAAEKILMYFDPNTNSPITLLELGLNAREFGKLMVCRPDGFWRTYVPDIQRISDTWHPPTVSRNIQRNFAKNKIRGH